MIEFQNVTKKYGKHVVLGNIDLTIPNSEFVVIAGSSGAGKSTLIYTLIGAEKLDYGEIIVDSYKIREMDLRSLQFFRRRIGVVFQDYKLLQRKNVYENVAFAMEVCGYSTAEIKNRVPEVLAIVGLQEHNKHFPHQLSGGERQRVAIARALVHHPILIVADEPTGNLDFKTAKGIIDLFNKINKDGIGIILTTHNLPLLEDIKCRIITLEAGKIVSDKMHKGYKFEIA